MTKIKLQLNTEKILADTITPVSLYLKFRDKFPRTCLLESSDYHSNSNNFSFICLEPIASISIQNFEVTKTGLFSETKKLKNRNEAVSELQNFISSFDVQQDKNLKANGLFGYTNFDAIKYFDSLETKNNTSTKYSSPDIHYSVFKYIIQIDHFKNELLIAENQQDSEVSNLEPIKRIIRSNKFNEFEFEIQEKESSNITDSEFKKLVSKGKEHCQRGDVFQIVFARQFAQSFKGDEFNVYRALRSINPSPYLFYFDFGKFKIFGSSPEAQIKVANGKATINPIAGTFKRTGNDSQDQLLAKKLLQDPKENAEHTMLVDLARNDLSRNGKNVTVKTYKETQFYSHVIHLVSEVEADLKENTNPIQIFADTFPAGTLSGAPKYKALKLISENENQPRGFYGGAIGYFGFDGSVNHAITIRSFFSKNNTLYSQAGAGVVVSSSEESELQEVNNKLGALKKALNLAQEI